MFILMNMRSLFLSLLSDVYTYHCSVSYDNNKEPSENADADAADQGTVLSAATILTNSPTLSYTLIFFKFHAIPYRAI